MIKLKVPFYPNSKDDLHCFQVSLNMVLSILGSSERYSFATLDRITGYKHRKVTWDTKALLWLARHGFNVKKISIFNYSEFARRGTRYLKEFWRPDVYEFQKSSLDVYREQQRVRRLLKEKNVKVIAKRPTLAMLERHLMTEWLAIIHIDVSRFDRTKDYSPHSIVITGVNAVTVSFHDPGLPPKPNRRISRKRFSKVLPDGELVLIKKAR